jgi:hypothetical protein
MCARLIYFELHYSIRFICNILDNCAPFLFVVRSVICVLFVTRLATSLIASSVLNFMASSFCVHVYSSSPLTVQKCMSVVMMCARFLLVPTDTPLQCFAEFLEQKQAA